MDVRYCEVDQVQVGERLRSLDANKVAALAESMDTIGLQQPISVWSDSIETLELVAGLHRLEAARKLGWEDIDCIFVNMDEIDRQLWEIDENLIRADLSAAEMAEHLKQRKELWEEREKKVGQVDPPSGQKKGFAKDTEDKTGTLKRTTNRAIARAEAILPEIMAMVKGTELDKGTYLDKLKNLSRDEQRTKVERDLVAMPITREKQTPDISDAIRNLSGQLYKFLSPRGARATKFAMLNKQAQYADFSALEHLQQQFLDLAKRAQDFADEIKLTEHEGYLTRRGVDKTFREWDDNLTVIQPKPRGSRT